MRFNSNYQADPNALLNKVSDFLDEKGFSPSLIGIRRGPKRIEYTNNFGEEHPNRHQISIFINPEPYDERGGYEIFRCVILLLDDHTHTHSTSTLPLLNLIAYTRFSDYEYLITELAGVLHEVFPIVLMNDADSDDASGNEAITPNEVPLTPNLADSEQSSFEYSTDKDAPVNKDPIAAYPIHVEDPTDQRILEIVQKEPKITDAELGLKIGNMSRQNVNRRRTTLAKMGYKVR